GFFRAETLDKLGVDAIHFGLALFTPHGNPLGYGASPGCCVFNHSVTIAEIVGVALELDIGQAAVGVHQVIEIRGMGGFSVVAVKAVFHQKLPVGADSVLLGAANQRHSCGGVVGDQIQIFLGARQ